MLNDIKIRKKDGKMVTRRPKGGEVLTNIEIIRDNVKNVEEDKSSEERDRILRELEEGLREAERKEAERRKNL